ncbi:uncharacterized protein TNCV_3126021 [Trichonephila clavipes]|nr:uncharacterized protein TNCV_3126021 [Trichonephila clavipes]
MKEVAEESMKMAAVEEYSSSPDNLLTELSDGKTIGGKGRLTDSLIDKLAHYYGNAIRCNSTSVAEMWKAIWAVWGHSCSTDDEPIHWFCPTNPNTCCKYNAAINNNLQNYKHKPSVAKAVQDVIKPVFADLSHPALLKKCLGVENCLYFVLSKHFQHPCDHLKDFVCDNDLTEQDILNLSDESDEKTTQLGNMNETTQQEKTTQLSSRNETTQLVSRNETTQLVSRNETTQLCTAVDRLQPPTTACN